MIIDNLGPGRWVARAAFVLLVIAIIGGCADNPLRKDGAVGTLAVPKGATDCQDRDGRISGDYRGLMAGAAAGFTVETQIGVMNCAIRDVMAQIQVSDPARIEKLNETLKILVRLRDEASAKAEASAAEDELVPNPRPRPKPQDLVIPPPSDEGVLPGIDIQPPPATGAGQ